MSKGGRYTTSVGSMRRGKLITLIFRIVLAIITLIFALFPIVWVISACLLYTSPSPRDRTRSRMPSSA